MGDAGEGLIDAQGKIQERMEELERNRKLAQKPAIENPEQIRKIESLQLARKQMESQLEKATHEMRRTQISKAIAEIDQRIAAIESGDDAK
jgi:hypothetical protein